MNLKLEKKLSKLGYQIIIGVDEVGRGPLAGPVTAAAVMVRKSQIPKPKSQTKSKSRNSNNQKNTKYQMPDTKQWKLVRDSKKLSAVQREECFQSLTHHPQIEWGVGMVSEKIIDKINILQATFLAMRKAVADLLKNLKKSNLSRLQRPKEIGPLSFSIILVDGNKTVPNLKMKQRVIVKGDEKVFSISAASIIAKVIRDRFMLKMHRKYPNYGFDKHKGYGTKIHLQNLEKYGPSSIHRLSFRPVKKA